jgi:DNA-binding NarL/FixJ family response regulator
MNRKVISRPARVSASVLMADPHALLLDGLQRLIETEHRVVGCVTDGESLVSEARQLRPDLVVSEVRLPVLGGLEAARRVLAERPGTRVAFLTTVEDPAIAAQAFAHGAAGYLLKSSTSAQFLDGLRAVLAGRRVLCPRLAGGDPDALRTRGSPGDRPPHIGPRAREVVRLLALGHSMKEAASVLGIATRTVAYHKYGAMAALGLGSSADLVRFAVNAGLLEPRASQSIGGAARVSAA